MSPPTCTPSPSSRSPTGPAASPTSRRSSPTPNGASTGSSSDRICVWEPPCSGPSSTRTQQRWRLVLASAGGEEQIVADTVIFACGQLNRPHVPDLPGLGDFTGPMWHSARWDHGCDLAGQAGGRGGERGERHPVRPAGGRAGRGAHHLPAHPQLRGPEEGPSLPGPDPMAVRQRLRRRARLPLVDLLEPRVPVDLVPQGQLGRPAS